jgi:hypothetical protein
VLFDGCRVRSIGRFRTMAFEAQNVRRLNEVSVIFSAVHVVATETRDAPGIHDARYKIVALHSILMRGAIRKMRERLLTELVLFQLPVILQIKADIETNRPIVILSFDRARQGAALRMTLDAGVVGLNEIETCRIHDIGARRPGGVLAAGAMAFFAAHVPFRDSLGLDVVVHRMATVTSRAVGGFEFSAG